MESEVFVQLHKSEMDIDDFFKNLFPENYRTEFLTQQFTDDSNTGGTCQARIALRSKDDFLQWLKEHQQLTGVTYRLRRTQCCKGKYSLYKADYRCHHNTLAHLNKSKQPAKKHTLCPANLSVTIKAVIENTRSTDPFLPHYPAIVTINHIHNHSINAVEAVRHKDPSEEVKQKFINLFKHCHTPSQALKVHKRNLMEEHKDNYSMVVADRSYCPDINWVFRLYHKYYAPKSRTKPAPLAKHVEPAKNFEEPAENFDEKSRKNAEGNLSLSNILPLMEEGQNLSESAEIVFVDSMGNILQKCKSSEITDQIWLSYENDEDKDNENSQPEEPEKKEENVPPEEETEEINECVGLDANDRQQYNIRMLESLFDNILANVDQHYANNPDAFDKAIKTAFTTYQGIDTESALITALESFGKRSDGATQNGVCEKRKSCEEEEEDLPNKEVRLSEHCYAINEISPV